MQFVNGRADVRKDILLFLQIIIQPEVNKMKKYLMAAALIGAIGFTSFSMANARGNYGYGPGPGYMPSPKGPFRLEDSLYIKSKYNKNVILLGMDTKPSIESKS